MCEAHLYVSECYFEGSNMAVMKLDVGGMLSRIIPSLNRHSVAAHMLTIWDHQI